MRFVKVELSCDVFSGFSRTIHEHEHNSMRAICAYVKRQLIATLELQNMKDLVVQAEKLELRSDSRFNTASDLFESETSLIFICECDHDDCAAEGAPQSPMHGHSHLPRSKDPLARVSGGVPTNGELTYNMMALLDRLHFETFLNTTENNLNYVCVMDLLTEENSTNPVKASSSRVSDEDKRAYIMLKDWSKYKEKGDFEYLKKYKAGAVLRLLLVPEGHAGIKEDQQRLLEDIELFTDNHTITDLVLFESKTLQACVVECNYRF